MKSRKFLWRALAALAGLAVVLVLAGPALATPLVRRMLVRSVEESVHGEARIAELSLTRGGEVRIQGFELTDEVGELVARIESLNLSVGLLALLGGTYDVDVTLDGFEVHAEQDETGRWSLADLPREDADEEDEGSGGRDESEEDELPNVISTIVARNGSVHLRRADATTVLSDLSLDASVDGLDRSLPLRASLSVTTGDKAAGRVVADGSMVLAEEGSIDAEAIEGTVRLELTDLRFDALQPFLGSEVPLELSTLNAACTLALDGAGAEVQGTLEAADLALELSASDAAAEESSLLRDPLVASTIDARIERSEDESSRLEIRRLQLSSNTFDLDLTGVLSDAQVLLEDDGELGIEGLEGELRYVPERLRALASPYFTGELLGAEEERLRFRLNGSAPLNDWAALLDTCEASADLGTGPVRMGDFDAGGRLNLELAGGVASWTGALAANGGTLIVSGSLALDGGSSTTLLLDADDVRATSSLAPLLALLHPAFAAFQLLEESSVGGLITSELELESSALLDPGALDDWESFPRESISGKGRFVINTASLESSPLLSQMLELVDVDAARSIDIRPIEFTIDAGRITYSRPWTWTLGEVETTFTGTVGLDESLALTWNVPITEELVERYDFLETLLGSLIEVPITGTIRGPKVSVTQVLGNLAKDVARNELLGALGIGSDSATPGSESPAREDPQALLSEADRLWKRGEKLAAAGIYKRLREEYKLTLVYALNRDRIKKRGKYRERD